MNTCKLDNVFFLTFHLFNFIVLSWQQYKVMTYIFQAFISTITWYCRRKNLFSSCHFGIPHLNFKRKTMPIQSDRGWCHIFLLGNRQKKIFMASTSTNPWRITPTYLICNPPPETTLKVHTLACFEGWNYVVANGPATALGCITLYYTALHWTVARCLRFLDFQAAFQWGAHCQSVHYEWTLPVWKTQTW